jgi:hypothetical protein
MHLMYRSCLYGWWWGLLRRFVMAGGGDVGGTEELEDAMFLFRGL